MPNMDVPVPAALAPEAAGDSRRDLWAQPFAIYAWSALAYNLAVILWGAVVRVTGSGAGCGDHWPLCNGTVTPLAPSVHTLIEFAHRVMSGLDVALVAVLAAWAFRAFPRGHAARLGAALSVVFLITEALIGAGLVLLKRVAQNADAWWISLHLINTFTLLACLALTAWWSTGHVAVRPRGRAARMGCISLASFALLGVSGAIAALGDTLFPARSLAESLAQDFNPAAHLFLRLRIWHPAMAAAVGAWLMFYALAQFQPASPSNPQDQSARKPGERTEPASAGMVATALARTVHKLACVVLAVMAAQMAAGALNLLLLAPVWLQLPHLLLADLLWIALVLLVAEASKVPPLLRR